MNLDGENTVNANVSTETEGVVHGNIQREEYHLTPENGDIHSQSVRLNGEVISVDSFGIIPELHPVRVNVKFPIIVAPFSVVFVHIPTLKLQACM